MRVLSILFVIVVFAFSCQQNTLIYKPNIEKSEMAVAMQNMVSGIKESRKSIANGSPVALNFDDFTNFHFTDSSFFKPAFNSMAQSFLFHSKRFDSIPIIEHLDNVITSCKSCHQSMCPGPLELINTLTNQDTITMNKSHRNKLSKDAYDILINKGTERPFSGVYNTYFEEGMYVCAYCNQELFTSDSKFKSSCGWPAFDASVASNVKEKRDVSLGMIRTEILCANCDGHLGHVFQDGPTKTGVRYCVNSLSMEFKEK